MTRTKFDPLGKVGLACRDNCFDVGLVMRACGDTMVLSPPLIITREQIDGLVGLAREAIGKTMQDIAA